MLWWQYGIPAMARRRRRASRPCSGARSSRRKPALPTVKQPIYFSVVTAAGVGFVGPGAPRAPRELRTKASARNASTTTTVNRLSITKAKYGPFDSDGLVGRGVIRFSSQRKTLPGGTATGVEILSQISRLGERHGRPGDAARRTPCCAGRCRQLTAGGRTPNDQTHRHLISDVSTHQGGYMAILPDLLNHSAHSHSATQAKCLLYNPARGVSPSIPSLRCRPRASPCTPFGRVIGV